MKANEAIAKNIQYHREVVGMKQETLAKILKITPSALSQIETGKTTISINRLEQIAKALNKSFFDLVTIPNHISGIQNGGTINTHNDLITEIKELLAAVNSLVENKKS